MLMLVGYLLHFMPDHFNQICQRTVCRLFFVGQVLVVTAVIYLVIQVKSSDIQPFIYFQF